MAKAVCSVSYSDLTWPEVQEAIDRDALIAIPTGAVEPHGFHLPLAVDSTTSYQISCLAATQAREAAEVYVTPPLWSGASYSTPLMPGALSLSRITYITVLKEICQCLIRYGFQRLCLINGHGGNAEQNRIVARDLAETHTVVIGTANYWELARDRLLEVRTSSKGTMGHAGEMETSLMLALEPGKVRMELRQRQIPEVDGRYYATDMLDTGRACLACSLAVEQKKGRGDIGTSNGIQALSPSPGVWGDPVLATEELGRKYLSIIVNEVAGYFEHLYKYRRVTQIVQE